MYTCVCMCGETGCWGEEGWEGGVRMGGGWRVLGEGGRGGQKGGVGVGSQNGRGMDGAGGGREGAEGRGEGGDSLCHETFVH